MTERFFSQDISDEFIKDSIQRLNRGEILKNILSDSEIQPGIRRTISKCAFYNKINQLKSINSPIVQDYHLKKGRKPVEIDIKSSVVYGNLKDFQNTMGINNMTQKIRSDLHFVRQHETEFNDLRQKITANPNLNIQDVIQMQNYTDGIDRTTKKSHIPESLTPPSQISDINYRLPTCLYLDPSIKPPSYNMGRKINEAILKCEEDLPKIPEVEKNYHKYEAAFIYQIVHADIHYLRHQMLYTKTIKTV
ncbi:hypothetical protein TVAG_486560 [Trichomonas vaginalis G3]|uniref:Uncharacterized protein n=1 Tax=Trichomonas vaginalis (strain ATCC PRA-98 / G3) TaxID=412133 RepID=A2GKU9_TRIV3|nr:hypothetical protein TVAG_486560 [Trichomonas vaginalis G3]|eukprot:XP_001295148.1 hypothetical protein [Trichomonas vaginalis G3]